MRSVSSRRYALTLLSLVAAVCPVTAQNDMDGAVHWDLEWRAARLAAGDTMSVVQALESFLARNPRDPYASGELGALLAAMASSGGGDSSLRARADRLLKLATSALPDDLRFYVAYGELLQKSGRFPDARRVLDRAIDRGLRERTDVGVGALTQALIARARALERRVVEVEGMRFAPTGTLPLISEGCPWTFCLNWEAPRDFFEWFAGLADMSGQIAADREQMLRDYWLALDFSPRSEPAARGILAAHARSGDWTALLESAARILAARGPAEDAGYVHLVHAAALHLSGAAEAAAGAFAFSLDRLAPEERLAFTDLRLFLDEPQRERWAGFTPSQRKGAERIYWRARDPLYLSAVNERQIEHYARMALAELLFGYDEEARRGWDTPRGEILVRYGLPSSIWQIARRDELVPDDLMEADLDGAATTDACRTAVAPDPRNLEDACQAQRKEAMLNTPVGGRWIFWNYGPDEPSFIFESALGERKVAHMRFSESANMATLVARRSPQAFVLPFQPVGPVPLQVARFRSIEEPSTWDVLIFAQEPSTMLVRDERRDSVERGLTVFRAADVHEVARGVARLPASSPADFRVRLDTGEYTFAVEMAGMERDRVASRRGRVEIPAPTPDLQMSDLLIAAQVRATVAAPRSHGELSFSPLRCLAVPPSRRLTLIFELYGLSEQEDGTAEYEVSLDFGAARAEGSLVRIVSPLIDLLGRGSGDAEAGRIRFLRKVQLHGDRVLEWLEVDVSELGAESLDLHVEVTDLSTGKSTRATRRLEDACAAL